MLLVFTWTWNQFLVQRETPSSAIRPHCSSTTPHTPMCKLNLRMVVGRSNWFQRLFINILTRIVNILRICFLLWTNKISKSAISASELNINRRILIIILRAKSIRYKSCIICMCLECCKLTIDGRYFFDWNFGLEFLRNFCQFNLVNLHWILFHSRAGARAPW